MIKVKRATEDTPGTLEIKVRINGNAANTGNVKDLKQLSGLHSHNSCMALQLCCKHVHPASQNLAVPCEQGRSTLIAGSMHMSMLYCSEAVRSPAQLLTFESAVCAVRLEVCLLQL